MKALSFFDVDSFVGLVCFYLFLSMVYKDVPRCADHFGTGYIDNGLNHVEL